MEHFKMGGGINLDDLEGEIKKAGQITAADLKEFGLDKDEEEDPELAALEKEEKAFTANMKNANKKDLTDADLENLDVNEDDLNDPNLLNELQDADEEGEKEAQGQLEKYKSEVQKCLDLALKCKKENKLEEAKKYLIQKKKLVTEIDKIVKEYPRLAASRDAPIKKAEVEKKSAPEKPQPETTKPEKKEESAKKVEAKKTEEKKIPVFNFGDMSKFTIEKIETKIHNLDKMAAVSVMEEEIKLMGALKAKAKKEEQSFYDEKKEHLEFRRDNLVSSIENQLISIDKYMRDIGNELIYEEAILQALKTSGAKLEDMKRVERRIELIKQEQAGPPADGEDKQEEKKEEKKEKKSEAKEVVQAKKIAIDGENAKEEKKAPLEDNKAKPISDATAIMKSVETLVISDEEVDFTKVDKKQYEVVSKRLSDYREAAEYFINNSLQKKGEAMIKKAEHLKACLNLIKQGKKIDLIKIEHPLTPEGMFGISIEERVKAFQALIDKLSTQFKIQRAMASETIEKAKGIKQLKSKAEKLLKKAKESSDMLAAVKAIQKNVWQPVPLFHVETVQDEKEIIQEEIAETDILIEYKPDPSIAGKSDYKIEYVIAVKEDTAKGTFEAHKPNLVKVPFAKGIKHVERAEASLTLVASSMLLFTKTIATMKFKLAKFASQGQVPIEFTDAGKKIKLSLLFKIRHPTKQKEVETTERKEVVIDSIYPAFRSQDSSVLMSVPVTGSVVPKTKPLMKGEEKKTTASQVIKPTQSSKDPPLPEVLPNLPKSIRDVDVRDPDDIGNLVCASYLEKKIASYTTAVKKMSESGQKVPEPLKQKLSLVTKNHAIITNQIDSGKLLPGTYKKFLENQLTKDQILLGYLNSLKQTSKAGIVKDRMLCIQKELQSFGK